MSNWIALSQTAGTSGITTITVTASSGSSERDTKYKVTTSDKSITVVFEEGLSYFTVYYDITRTGHRQLTYDSKGLVSYRINDGEWETAPTATGSAIYNYFVTTGQYKVDYKTSTDKIENRFIDNINNIITDIVIPSSYTGISQSCFANLAINNPTLYEGLKELGWYCFGGCNNITNVTLPSTITKNNGAFASCRGLSAITFLTTEVGYGICQNCMALTDIVFAQGCDAVGYDAFSACTSLSEVIFPSSLNNFLGDSCFKNCTSLSTIYAYSPTAATLYSNVFTNISSTGTLHYPSGSDYSTWIAALPSGWTAIADL